MISEQKEEMSGMKCEIEVLKKENLEIKKEIKRSENNYKKYHRKDSKGFRLRPSKSVDYGNTTSDFPHYNNNHTQSVSCSIFDLIYYFFHLEIVL